ncbi:MAG TPA: hypothetical protein PLI07_07625, partial [Candidatus Hydrogenedentes bacterium]|nr:hypothetical protein [Candidatus Hydrogenedentota bacterium]
MIRDLHGTGCENDFRGSCEEDFRNLGTHADWFVWRRLQTAVSHPKGIRVHKDARGGRHPKYIRQTARVVEMAVAKCNEIGLTKVNAKHSDICGKRHTHPGIEKDMFPVYTDPHRKAMLRGYPRSDSLVIRQYQNFHLFRHVISNPLWGLCPGRIPCPMAISRKMSVMTSTKPGAGLKRSGKIRLDCFPGRQFRLHDQRFNVESLERF